MNASQDTSPVSDPVVPPGTHELGPATGSLTIRTGRAGMAAKAGHDLLIEVARWSGTLAIDPAEPARSSLALTADPGSLEVREGVGGVKPLTDDDRREISRNIADKVLNSARHTQVTFASTAVRQTNDHALMVDGNLQLVGVTRPVQFEVMIAPDPSGTTLRSKLSLTQSRFGIRPFSALMGTLKVADDVEVIAEARLPKS